MREEEKNMMMMTEEEKKMMMMTDAEGKRSRRQCSGVT